MTNRSFNSEKYIWTPLIGFDKERTDHGVEEYYSKLGFKPDGISLFVFCPDIVHYHDGMETERILPPDNCNYYGNVRNEIRGIQRWTNYDLRELVHGLEKRGASTFMGLMGVFVDRDPQDPYPYNIGHHEWLFDHKEIIGVWMNSNYSLNVLKRFNDGTYYEDFFLEKARKALRDYGFSGLHVADNFCPQREARHGDFSDDMVGQFMAQSGVELPAEICGLIDWQHREGIQKRGEYIWNQHKLEWLNFLSWRWGTFWKKICDGLHEDGKKVIVNNAWCSEPFEAIYRYGIDYKKLYEAGVDYMAAESLPTSVHSGAKDETERYRFYDYTTMPSFMRASVPEGKVLCLNGVKDSTEEWSNITYYPSNLEREIYSLTNYFLQTPEGLMRTTEGLMVCLGDGLTSGEWSWLRERWEVAFGEIPEKVLTPTLIWSDHALARFLPDYVETKRWSSHKTFYELAKAGGQIGVIARIEDLSVVSGPIFIPNIDLLAESEIKMIAAYDRGAIICTSLVERIFQMPDLAKPDLYFEDPMASYKMCLFAYHLNHVDYQDVTASLGEDDGSKDVAGDPRYAPDPGYFREDLVFRKVSTGFIKASSTLIRACTPCELTTEMKNQILPMQMKDGKIRLLLGNDNRLQYHLPEIKSKRTIKQVIGKSTFPALPAKLLDVNGKIIHPMSDGSHKSILAYGFIAKIPPGGFTILDVELGD